MRILLVEDNETYRENLKKILELEEYEVDDVADPITGVEYIGIYKYDLVISDLIMELMDGNRFLTFVRKVQPDVRTIILTGKPTPNTEMEAIDNYVDHYLSKDIHLDVLLKYVERLLAATPVSGLKFYSESDGICLDVEARTLQKNGKEIKITKKEFSILYMLLSNKGKAISRAEFIEQLWDKRFEEVEERVIDVHIKVLRRKINTSSIIAIRGYGYKWDE